MTTRLLKTAFAAVALGLPALLSTPASADVAVAAGTAQISPGVPTTGSVCTATFVFNGTAANLGNQFGPGPYSFTYTGSTSQCESILSGGGTGNFTGDVTGAANYSRTTGVITLSSTGVRIRGSVPVPLSATCTVEVLSANPVTLFAVTCVAQVGALP